MALDQSEASILGHCGWFNMGKIGLRSLVITPCPYTTGGATANIGGMTAVLAAALRGQ